MSIQKNIIVRYRNEGHIRFEIPERLCDKAIANTLSNEILKIDGVYKVDLFKRQRKLSIRYQETICEFRQLAKQLFNLISELEKQGSLAPQLVKKTSSSNKTRNKLESRFKEWKATKWAAEKYSDAKETVQAAKTITKIGLKKPKLFFQDPEKALIDFLNDILLLYLIKLHWTRITQEWIPKPWVFRYQWTAVFYLFYLLMRSRRPK